MAGRIYQVARLSTTGKAIAPRGDCPARFLFLGEI